MGPPRTPACVVGSSPPPIPYSVVTHRKETANLSIAKTAQNREILLLPRRPRARTSARLVRAPAERKADAEAEAEREAATNSGVPESKLSHKCPNSDTTEIETYSFSIAFNDVICCNSGFLYICTYIIIIIILYSTRMI